MDELENLAKLLVDYLRKNHHPHTAIIATYDRVAVVEDLVGIPFPLLDDQFVEFNPPADGCTSLGESCVVKTGTIKVDNPLETIQKAVENVCLDLDNKVIARSVAEAIHDTPEAHEDSQP